MKRILLAVVVSIALCAGSSGAQDYHEAPPQTDDFNQTNQFWYDTLHGYGMNWMEECVYNDDGTQIDCDQCEEECDEKCMNYVTSHPTLNHAGPGVGWCQSGCSDMKDQLMGGVCSGA